MRQLLPPAGQFEAYGLLVGMIAREPANLLGVHDNATMA
jgi:hypothetical protein